MEEARHDTAVNRMLDLYAILKSCGLEDGRELKLYRHAVHVARVGRVADQFPHRSGGGRVDIEKVYSADLIIPFQSVQRNYCLGNDLVAFFIGEDDGATRFIGMHKIVSREKFGFDSPFAEVARKWNFLAPGDAWHEMTYDDRFASLENRLVIAWSGRSHRWLVEKNRTPARIEVLEVRSPGAFPSFPGFNRLLLSYSELKKHLMHENTSEWVKVLVSTRGVYLITDTKRGNLYVGSATGERGLWGRWRSYAASGHGGNKLIRIGIEDNLIDKNDFQISVLETLSNLSTREDGIKSEMFWKERFGGKALTLNGN
jgi:hypothetical protein